MKNTTLVITILATLIGTASVSFGDTKKCASASPKNGLQKLQDLKGALVVAENNAPLGRLENDPRQVLDRNQHPEYNAIGAVTTSLGRGTAWLGNECLVWTAKHVLGRNKNVIGQKVKFSVGQSQKGDKNFEYEVDGEVVASGNPEAQGPDGSFRDWALIKLNKSIGKKVGHIETSQYSVKDAETCKSIEVAGFPGEKDVKNLWWQGNCTLNSQLSGTSAFNISCPATPGNSGGPLLCREADGSLNAIGVVMQQDIRTAAKGSVALNFTAEWGNAKAAFQKYMNSCPQD